MTDEQRIDRVRAVLGDVFEALKVPAEEAVPRQLLLIDSFTRMTYMRARSLFAAVRVLIDAEYIEEAWILGRALFETSVLLGHFELSSDSAQDVKRWVNESLSHYARVARAAEKTGDERDLASTLARIERAYAPGPLPAALKDIEAAARRQGREEDIPNYIASHGFAHGTMPALLFRARPAEENVLIVHERGVDPDLVESGANFAARSALSAQRSACALFGWSPAGLEQLFEAVEFGNGRQA